MSTGRTFIVGFVLLALFGCEPMVENDSSQPPAQSLGSIFYNGDIITMEGDKPQYVEAVVEGQGRILFAGSREAAFDQYQGRYSEVDLQGNTLMPGFIEPHAHPVSIGAFILANDIVAPHEWRMPHKTYPGVSGKAEYLEAVGKIIKSKQDPSGTVMIWGYHKAWHGTLTLADLDRVTGEVPTVIWQRSTHEIYLNTACAKKYNIRQGVLQEQVQVDWANLHFWERGYQEIKSASLAPFFADKAMLQRGMQTLSQMMLNNGLIAMAEPSFPNSSFDTEYAVLKEETERAQSYGIYLIPGFPEQFVMGMSNEDYLKRVESFPSYNTEYIQFLPRQYKTFGDGAIYSLALQLRDGFVGCPDCHPEWIVPPGQGQQIFDFWWDAGYKVHIHITGDLAFEKYLDIVEQAQLRTPRTDHRTTFHHTGLFDAQQAERAQRLGVEISANPYYLWALADKYSETGFGPARAANMVAMKELTDRKIPLSLHSDFAMAPAEPLLLAWVAVNRTVASGKAMRPEQGISVFTAMRGVTLGAARTFEMEDELGSIKAGKQASFTILAENPFKINPAKLKDIEVVAVVYKGRYIEKQAAL